MKETFNLADGVMKPISKGDYYFGVKLTKENWPLYEEIQRNLDTNNMLKQRIFNLETQLNSKKSLYKRIIDWIRK